MIQILLKNLKVMRYSKSLWINIAYYWIFLLYFKCAVLSKTGLPQIADVLVMVFFSLILMSIPDNLDRQIDGHLLTSSLPVTRREIIGASYLTCLVFTFLAMIYTQISGLLVVNLLPQRIFADTTTLQLNEILLAFFMVVVNHAINLPLSLWINSAQPQFLIKLVLIPLTMINAFVVLPLIAIALSPRVWVLFSPADKGPFMLVSRALMSFSHLPTTLSLILVAVVFVFLSMKLSTRLFSDMDLRPSH